VRVLHVLNELRPSGAEEMLRLSAQPWRTRGLQLDILSLGDTPGPFAEALREAGFVIHHQPLRPVKAFAPAFARLLRVGGFDVVHVHPERANFVVAMMARFLGRARVVRTVHNVFEFSGRLRIERLVQRAVLRTVGVTHVAVGESVAETERRRFRNPAIVVRNTFDEIRFAPPTPDQRERARARFSLEADELVAVLVGNCSRVKNHRALFEALELPVAPAVRVIHVGLEDEPATDERGMLRRAGLEERVAFLGFVDDVPPLMHAADVFVMPSLYEGLGNAALEALACGLPAVLADVPGLRDLRSHIPDAWWVEPRADAIAEALAEVAAMAAADRRCWSRHAVSTVRAEFGVQRHVDAYLALYGA
jgi:glycosyltransferase involved in cell wall biosynthesis